MTNKPKRRCRVRNWRDYNKALVSRGSLTLWVDARSTDARLDRDTQPRRGRRRTYASVLGSVLSLFFAEAQDYAERKPASIIHFIEEVCPQVVYLESADGDSIIHPYVEPAAERDA